MKTKININKFDINIKTYNSDPTYMWDFEPEELTYENTWIVYQRKVLELSLSNIK